MTNEPESEEPFHRMLSPEIKPIPFAVKVSAAPPAMAVVGEMEIKVGTGIVMEKLEEFETAPPGACTVIEALPAVASILEGTSADNCVGEINVVPTAELFHNTPSPLTKLLPAMVRERAGAPATAVFGEIDVMEGGGGGVVMGKLRELEAVPPGACTTIEEVPAEETRLDKTDAVSCVGETNVVPSGAPFQRTTSPLTKLLPDKARENAGLPAKTLTGKIEFRIGAGGVEGATLRVTKTVVGEFCAPGAVMVT